jgi:hypothetical protein
MSLVIPTVIPMAGKGNCGIDERVQSIREMRLRPLTERPSILEYFGVIYLDLVSNPIAWVYTAHQPLDAAGTDKAGIDDLYRIQ